MKTIIEQISSLTERGEKREQKIWFVFTENSLEIHNLVSVFYLTSLANNVADSDFAWPCRRMSCCFPGQGPVPALHHLPACSGCRQADTRRQTAELKCSLPPEETATKPVSWVLIFNIFQVTEFWCSQQSCVHSRGWGTHPGNTLGFGINSNVWVHRVISVSGFNAVTMLLVTRYRKELRSSLTRFINCLV